MTTCSAIHHENNVTHGAYRAEVNGSARPAELTWQARGSVRIVDHTFVPSEARGQGIALKLVEAIVEDAREDGFTIDPQCPYVAKVFERNARWNDLRAPRAG